MPRALVALGCLTLALLTPSSARADGLVVRVGRGFLGGREATEIYIVIRDGKIVQVGEGSGVWPSDLPVIHYPDGYVTPGLVAAASDIIPPHRAANSVGAAFRAVDAFDRYADHRPLLAAGVTVAHVGPGEHRLLAGQGAVVKVAGAPADRVLVETADLTLQIGDPADGPPLLVEFPFPPSSDVAMEPSQRQRPRTRLSRLLGLQTEIAAALDEKQPFDFQLAALAEAWRAGRPLRVAADRAVDILAGHSFIVAEKRTGYIVGGMELQPILRTFERVPLPVIYRPSVSLRGSGADLGLRRDALESDFPDFAWSRAGAASFPLGIGPPRQGPVEDLRLGAVLAHREGLERSKALAAITSVPASVLGVGDRVGSLAVGRDADLVIWNVDPLRIAAQPVDVFVNGRRAWQPEGDHATVIRAGTLWVSPDRRVENGELLMEDGKIVAVGTSVPHPPHATYVDAGPDSFVTPGFIDARGHLGLRGDQGSIGTGDRIGKIIGVPDVPEERVAHAGITTVMVGPYKISGGGSSAAAIKTWGSSREHRVVRDSAAILFQVAGDPLAVKGAIQRTLGRGKKYLQGWQKYEKALAEWKEKTARGEKVEVKDEEETTDEVRVDPVTGVWDVTASGGPLQEPMSGKVSMKLSGNQVEGRIIEPPVPVDHRIVLTLEGNKLTGTVEADIDIPDTPRIEAELGEDTIKGKLNVLAFSIDFSGSRSSKEAIEYKVTRRKKSSKDGRPTAPRVDPALEPIRQLLEKKIPAVVRVNGVDRIEGILDLFLKEEKLPLILLEADGARLHMERLAKSEVGVILPVSPLTRVKGRSFNPADFYTRHGVAVAFQSSAADGARDLPQRALFSVDRGLGADAALEAMTTAPARMFELDDRIGSLEPGRDADLLIFRGHPFRDGGRLMRVWINGEEVSQ